MKKVLLGLALATMLGGTAIAQNAPATKCPDKTACADNPACKGKKQACANPFEGLNLTPEQQSKLDALKTQQVADSKKNRDEARQAREAAKTDRREQRKAQLQQIKAILTPEQYVQFLENAYLRKDSMNKAGRKDDMRPGKGPKDGKDMRPGKDPKDSKKRDGQRPDRQAQQPDAK